MTNDRPIIMTIRATTQDEGTDDRQSAIGNRHQRGDFIPARPNRKERLARAARIRRRERKEFRSQRNARKNA